MEYLIQIAGGLLGIAIHIFAVKLPEHKKKVTAANMQYSIKEWWSCDWQAVVASILTVFATVYVLDEILTKYPVVKDWVKGFMLAIGYMGSSIAVATLGKASAAVLKVIDVKTNIADAKDATNQQQDEDAATRTD